ncbi:glycosyltransferase family 4 protein [Nocardioides massiliensis]|uniref:Phosphatidylinositol alpha-mannosyltransferase n=1 Tax=Nocardioides massiliensis TaxID=1325935 RepID=A0ABT9NQV0_9ACTN|nr:glycosyltransferase family 4 protein [Nocardioides massiliensis]MDP9822804.1 phosphatidylinositol alpha-mannosyltransferase [Nocardioides massiliensis]
MRIGIVCPYSFETFGGVQIHVLDLAEALMARGHEVAVLAPAEDDTPLPDFVTSAGGAVPIPYNGSVGRLAFGPVAVARVRRWLREQDLDVLHVHEPGTPSVSLLAVASAEVPVVATFHTSQVRSRAMSAASALLRPFMEKIDARIAVSEHARSTLVQHQGGEPVVIPNGVDVGRYVAACGRDEWRGDPTLAFVGRLDEERKGFAVLAQAWPRICRAHPGARLLVVGAGDVDQARELLGEHAAAVEFLGRVDDPAKADALATADLYVAPNTRGESFGIVLVEAMAAGACVLASDIPAFRSVLQDGELGAHFANRDAHDLADQAIALLGDPDRRAALVAASQVAVRRYDWSTVAAEILEVYETVVQG